MLKIFAVRNQSKAVSCALCLLRLVCGLAFMFHGFNKIQNPFHWMGAEASVPAAIQMLAALAEFGGGLAWIFGFLMPLASLGIASTMLGAMHMHIMIMGDPFVGRGGSYELAAVYFCVAFLFLCAGPGRFSVDRKLFGER